MLGDDRFDRPIDRVTKLCDTVSELCQTANAPCTEPAAFEVIWNVLKSRSAFNN